LGQHIGWGDLDHTDFLNIQAGLNGDEIFVILDEGKLQEIQGNVQRVAAECCYLITSQGIYGVTSYEVNVGHRETFAGRRGAFTLTWISREEALRMMTS